MPYSVYWADRYVQKTFEKLDPPMQKRITTVIAQLALNPHPQGSKKLSGKLAGVWRVRIGDFRLLYDLDDKNRRIALLELGHRRQIYR